ncbi:actin-like protein arp8 [Serendipita sp. 399]|nr:actin-like protein arp8 [Serendipita sp. 399]
MDVDSKETNSDTAKPTILDIPSRKRVVKSYRTESPPLVLPEDMVFPGGLPIDIPFETSKLPLDVAIFNSTRAASETATLTVVTKFLQNTLLIGGTSQTPEIDVYLFYRLRAIASAFYQTEVPRENIRIVQKPKELDPRIIIWKGASVLARLETSSEFWVTQRDWDRLGIRAFRDRSLFM